MRFKGFLNVVLPIILIGTGVSIGGYASRENTNYEKLTEETGYYEYTAKAMLKSKGAGAFAQNTYVLNFTDDNNKPREAEYKTIELLDNNAEVLVKYNAVENISQAQYPPFEKVGLMGIAVILALVGITLEAKAFAPMKGNGEVTDTQDTEPTYAEGEEYLMQDNESSENDDNSTEEMYAEGEEYLANDTENSEALYAEGEEYLAQESSSETSESDSIFDE